MRIPKGQVRFERRDPKQFFRTLNKRVNQYFKENKLKKTGNWRLYVKTFVMFSIFITPYVLILSLDINQWVKLLLCVCIGVGMAGIGMNVMHDGNHGSYSKYEWVNKLMGGSIYILAGNVFNWKVQHNVLHHTFTNIHGHDEDLEAGVVMRFSKHSKWRKFHRFQHLYFILLYGLLTIKWALVTDFLQLKRYLKNNLSHKKNIEPKKEWGVLILSKAFYLLIWIVLPLLILDLSWWKILIGFFVMHYTAGLILSTIFQLAHIVEPAHMPTPSEKGDIKNTWAIHQLFTTVNFSVNNRFIRWFTGGLNHQIEHHIFPYISHVHYFQISKIVKKTAKEFELPYHEFESTRAALTSHYYLLKNMGRKPIPVKA